MERRLFKTMLLKVLPHLEILFLFISCVFFVGSCEKKTPTPSETVANESPAKTSESAKIVMQSSLAEVGWYTPDTDALREQIEGFYKKTQVEPIEDTIALILPHAGYQYSGETAVVGLSTLKKQYKRIVVIGPSHRLPMEDIFSVPRVTHYETPFGQIPLDVEFIETLLKFQVFQNVPPAHQQEHSVQIELPLLQLKQKDFKLVPIVAGQCSLETIEKAADILKGLLDTDTLVIASSDFVHYGRVHLYVPFTKNIPEKIKELDMGAYIFIENLDAKGFLKFKDQTKATICGSVPIAVLLSTLDESSKAHLIKYTTSGEMSGDYSNSVSYMSIAFSGRWKNSPVIEPQEDNTKLTEEDKEQLLILARKTIVYALKNRKVPQVSDLDVKISDAMNAPRAAFVTLNKNSQLRGCIGDIIPQRPLYKSVIRNAINAAFNDTRFSPVTDDELGDITIEISALTVPKPISSPDEIRIGIDGVILSKDGRSAVFLPQVAPEQGWDVSQMLTYLSLKAGLHSEAWKEGADFQIFQAVVFGENEK
ncbi:MAG: AmmeMemoRadiSam system protein B [Sedimentisphaerales bacterium]|nr:AmmeMemoRadiSam system protein B [Sedimentisphaerales bacterium]